MTERLNKDIREELVDDVIASTFKERKARLEEARTQCGENAYKTIFGPYQDQIGACPDWFWDEMDEIELVGEGKGAYYGPFPLQQSRRFPRTRTSSMGADHHISKFPDLEAQVVQVCLESEQITKDERLARKQLTEALRGFRTVKQLQEKWPEVAAFLSPESQNHYPLMAVNIREINQKLGLSSPEKGVN